MASLSVVVLPSRSPTSRGTIRLRLAGREPILTLRSAWATACGSRYADCAFPPRASCIYSLFQFFVFASFPARQRAVLVTCSATCWQIFIDGFINFLSWYGLCLSLRTTLPILNGFLFPEAPVFVKDKVYPFLYFISEPFLTPFRNLVPLRINGFDLAVFPAFAGVLFIIAVTGKVRERLAWPAVLAQAQ